MEHIVQFGISIDDERIRESVERQAASAIIKEISDNIAMSIRSRYSRSKEEDWRIIVEDKAADFVKENADAILDCAISLVAEKMQKSKAYRDACRDAVSMRVSAMGNEEFAKSVNEAARDDEE